MNAGDLDQLIYFEYPSNANVGGELITTWVDASGESPPAPDHADIISQKGNEAFTAARTQSNSLIRGVVRYRSDIKTDWRVKWDGKYYNITDIDRSQRRDGVLWFTAENTAAK